MTASEPRFIFLTGAPSSDALDWNQEQLIAELDSNFQTPIEGHAIKTLPTSASLPAWRFLPLQRRHLATGPSQGSFDAAEDLGPSFFTASDISFTSTEIDASWVEPGDVSFSSTTQELLSQFYEHSFAVHEDVAASPLDDERGADDEPSGIEQSMLANVTGGSLAPTSQASPPDCIPPKPVVAHVTDIICIPDASYLYPIIPQMRTVNLIVGVIHIEPTRVVQTRRAGREMDIVEMVVGDDTRAGFGVNFWFPPEQASKPAKPIAVANLRRTLSDLRPGDVILVQSIALSSFRGRVFGQSLRGNVTKVHLLYRTSDTHRRTNQQRPLPGATDPQSLKIHRVRDWVLQFVGSAMTVHQPREILPPDTP